MLQKPVAVVVNIVVVAVEIVRELGSIVGSLFFSRFLVLALLVSMSFPKAPVFNKCRTGPKSRHDANVSLYGSFERHFRLCTSGEFLRPSWGKKGAALAGETRQVVAG